MHTLLEEEETKNDSHHNTVPLNKNPITNNNINATIHEKFKIQNNLLGKINPINQIFKKILIENNTMFHYNPKMHKCSEVSIHSSNINNPLSYHEKVPNLGRARVIIFSDMTNDSDFEFNQKYMFLMKREDIHIDCISVGTNEIIVLN
jgi:hypothetical protein